MIAIPNIAVFFVSDIYEIEKGASYFCGAPFFYHHHVGL